jgi:hypothetical protein
MPFLSTSIPDVDDIDGGSLVIMCDGETLRFRYVGWSDQGDSAMYDCRVVDYDVVTAQIDDMAESYRLVTTELAAECWRLIARSLVTTGYETASKHRRDVDRLERHVRDLQGSYDDATGTITVQGDRIRSLLNEAEMAAAREERRAIEVLSKSPTCMCGHPKAVHIDRHPALCCVAESCNCPVFEEADTSWSTSLTLDEM